MLKTLHTTNAIPLKCKTKKALETSELKWAYLTVPLPQSCYHSHINWLETLRKTENEVVRFVPNIQ